MKDVTIERSYNVIKSNDLIRHSRYDLSLVEQKIILRLIQLIKPQDKEFNEYHLDINEFCSLCGIEQNNGTNILNIKTSLKQLHDKSFWIKIGEEDVLCSWVAKVKINARSGDVIIKLDDDLKPFLLELKKNFTEYSLFYILAMKSKYSIRMYEMLKSYQFKNNITINIDELKITLLANHYERFYDFKKNVITLAINEINMFTDLIVTYDFKKKGKSVTSVNFKIRYKDMDEQLKMFRSVGNNLAKDENQLQNIDNNCKSVSFN